MKTNKYVNVLRDLAVQAIKMAGQGHPGMAISATPIIYAIYTANFKMNWRQPKWIDRDRLLLSAGHGCMALYPILHVITKALHDHDPTGAPDFLTMEELKAFRQPHSRTPGHPENGLNPWLEATTGPLGQGVAQGVGMAIAEAHLRASGQPIDHYTYIVVGDGDLQEGISYEAMSLAGRLGLNHLIVLHDSNAYQLETAVADVNSEDIQQRVESMHWYYQQVDNDPKNIRQAIANAKGQRLPAYIEVKTVIGEGLSYAESFEAHGGVINDAELQAFRDYYDLPSTTFTVDEAVYDHLYERVVEPGDALYQEWKAKNPHGWEHLDHSGAIYEFLKNHSWDDHQNVATRVGAKTVLTALNEAELLDDLFIMSADLAKSTNIKLPERPFNLDHQSTFLHAGVREFAIAGALVGINLHGGMRGVMSTFLAFSDYLKAAIRLGALAKAGGFYVFTHDSILLGSDGPTHQPVEQLAMLRTIPTVEVFRPCDTTEVAAAFASAWTRSGPLCLVLSRQAIVLPPTADGSLVTTDFNLAYDQGGYLLHGGDETVPDFLILASGSEVALALELQKALGEAKAPVYSVPNLNRFLQTNHLPRPRYGLIILEASNDPTWYRLAPEIPRLFVGVSTFGQSMDGQMLYQANGFSVPQILGRIEDTFHWKP